MNKKQLTDQLKIEHLVPGMKIGRDVYYNDGQVLIGEGTVISNFTIAKLKQWNVESVGIVAKTTANPIVDPKLQTFVSSYNNSVFAVRQAFDDIRTTQTVPLETFSGTAEEIAANVAEAGNVIDRLYDSHSIDDVTLRHSVNVGVIATLIATWMGYPSSVINDLSLAGLLHDIGKARIPAPLLNRPDQLSGDDYEAYKKHVAYGFELVRDLPDLPDSIKACILQHHERTDGSGYLLRLAGDKIHPYARILAVADIYDEALTVCRDPEIYYSPYCALEQLDTIKYRLDPEVCVMFINRMLNCLSGHIVALTDGREARVVFLNTVQPARPIVQLTDGTVLDLSEEPELRIHHVIR